MTPNIYFDQVAVFLPPVLSAILLLLAILVQQKTSFGARTRRDTARDNVDKLCNLTDELNRIAKILPESDASEGDVRDSPAAQFIAEVLEAYRAWGKVLCESIRSTQYSGWINGQQNDLQSILERVRQTGGARNRQLEQDQKYVSKIVYLAVEKTDREIDEKRKHRDLQTALGRLVAAARMQLIDPRPGNMYTDSARRVTVKIGKVCIRGLRDSSGQILYELEYEEEY